MKIRNSARVIVINNRAEFVLVKYEDRVPVDPADPHLLASCEIGPMKRSKNSGGGLFLRG